jgi:hypothetical protein
MSRQLHLNLPTSPTVYQGSSGDSKVTDMSLGSDGSSTKTPGFESSTSFQKNKQSSFVPPTPTLQEIEELKIAPSIMKRSVSSTLDEEEDDDDLDGDGVDGGEVRCGGNNNNEYINESSDDNLLESLDRKVCMMWEAKTVSRQRRRLLQSTHSAPSCCCHCRCTLCRYPSNVNRGHLTEEEEDGDADEVGGAGGGKDKKSDQYKANGRTESNETLDSHDNDTYSSREDIFGEDEFPTFSDEEDNVTTRHDSNYSVIKRRCLMRRPIPPRRTRLQTHPLPGRSLTRTSSTFSSEDDFLEGVIPSALTPPEEEIVGKDKEIGACGTDDDFVEVHVDDVREESRSHARAP